MRNPLPDRERVPAYHYNNEQSRAILETLTDASLTIKEAVADVVDQFFVGTADWGLELWEASLGLAPEQTGGLETRRARVLAKLNTRGVTTVQAIRDMVEIVTGRKGDVAEHFDQYTFSVIVHFLLADTTANIRTLFRQVEEIKPAHLSFDIVGAFCPAEWKNSISLSFCRMLVRTHFITCCPGAIRLNGSRRLDGTWILDQAFTGMHWERVAFALPFRERKDPGPGGLRLSGARTRTKECLTVPLFGSYAEARSGERASFRRAVWSVSVRQNCRLIGTLSRNTMWRLDGAYCLSGIKKLNAAITKEEI